MSVMWYPVLYLVVGLATLVLCAVMDRVQHIGSTRPGDNEVLVPVFLWPVVWVFAMFLVAASLLRRLYSLVRGSGR